MADKPLPLRSGRINCKESCFVISFISPISFGIANMEGLEYSFLNTYRTSAIIINSMTPVVKKNLLYFARK